MNLSEMFAKQAVKFGVVLGGHANSSSSLKDHAIARRAPTLNRAVPDFLKNYQMRSLHAHSSPQVGLWRYPVEDSNCTTTVGLNRLHLRVVWACQMPKA